MDCIGVVWCAVWCVVCELPAPDRVSLSRFGSRSSVSPDSALYWPWCNARLCVTGAGIADLPGARVSEGLCLPDSVMFSCQSAYWRDRSTVIGVGSGEIPGGVDGDPHPRCARESDDVMTGSAKVPVEVVDPASEEKYELPELDAPLNEKDEGLTSVKPGGVGIAALYSE